jgi:hypothetical protein
MENKMKNKDEAIQFLRELINNINEQDNRATASPYYFTIETKEKCPTDPDYNCDGSAWILDGESYTCKEARDYVLEKYDVEVWPYTLPKEHFEFNYEFILEEEGFNHWHYQEIEKYDNFFFTEKAANQHLKINGHNYESPKTYVKHAYRNSEIEDLLKAISIIIDTKLIRR